MADDLNVPLSKAANAEDSGLDGHTHGITAIDGLVVEVL